MKNRSLLTGWNNLLERLREAQRHYIKIRARRQALKTALSKPDNHLLDDAGLTRCEAENLLDETGIFHDGHRLHGLEQEKGKPVPAKFAAASDCAFGSFTAYRYQ